MIELEVAVQAVADDKVDFVIIGGAAIKIHSSGYVTLDLDFCYARTRENLTRIIAALSKFNPRPRDFPYERDVQVLSIAALINAKRAAGRVKDLLVLT